MSELLNTDINADLSADRPMRADARRNRARILQAARDLFAGDGHDVQIDDVARRAVVGVGTVYRHFPDKDALMGELVRQRFVMFNERMQRALSEAHSDPFEALAATFRDNAASLDEDAATRFAFNSGGERVFAHARAEYEQFMRLASELVERAHAAGQLRQEFQALDIPMIMCGVCAAMDHRKAGWDWERYLELVLGGMRSTA
jgi:AcrR family transcriptional regulator